MAPGMSASALLSLFGDQPGLPVQPGNYRDVLSGRRQRAGGSIQPADWLGELPVAVLEYVD